MAKFFYFLLNSVYFVLKKTPFYISTGSADCRVLLAVLKEIKNCILMVIAKDVNMLSVDWIVRCISERPHLK